MIMVMDPAAHENAHTDPITIFSILVISVAIARDNASHFVVVAAFYVWFGISSGDSSNSYL